MPCKRFSGHHRAAFASTRRIRWLTLVPALAPIWTGDCAEFRPRDLICHVTCSEPRVRWCRLHQSKQSPRHHLTTTCVPSRSRMPHQPIETCFGRLEPIIGGKNHSDHAIRTLAKARPAVSWRQSAKQLLVQTKQSEVPPNKKSDSLQADSKTILRPIRQGACSIRPIGR